jgi:hypothetical protein
MPKPTAGFANLGVHSARQPDNAAAAEQITRPTISRQAVPRPQADFDAVAVREFPPRLPTSCHAHRVMHIVSRTSCHAHRVTHIVSW